MTKNDQNKGSVLDGLSFEHAGAEAEQNFQKLVDGILGEVNHDLIFQIADEGDDEKLLELLSKYKKEVTKTLDDGTEIYVYRWSEGDRGLARGITLQDTRNVHKFILWPIGSDPDEQKTGFNYDYTALDSDLRFEPARLDSGDFATLEKFMERYFR
jgi:hypothetical protein